jgi:hypothetical protein
MGNHDLLVGELNAGIRLGHRGIVPVLDLAKENAGQDIGCKFQLLGDARNVIGGNNRAEHRRHMKNLHFGFRQLFVRHRPVAGPKIDRSFQQLADASTAADGLIVDLNVGICFVEFAKPFRVHRIWECSTGAVQVNLRPGANAEKRNAACDSEKTIHSALLDSALVRALFLSS